MAELVDALDSKSCFRKEVQVRFLFRAHSTKSGIFFKRLFKTKGLFLLQQELCDKTSYPKEK